MAYFYRLISIFLICLSFNAYAAFPLPPAGHIYTPAPVPNPGVIGSFTSPQAACDAVWVTLVPYYGGRVTGTPTPTLRVPTNPFLYDCRGVLDGVPNRNLYSLPSHLATPSCPANSTQVGQTCVCNSPFAESNGQCVDQNVALCSLLNGQTDYATVPGSASPGGSTCSALGCAATFTAGIVRVTPKSGSPFSEGPITFTGGTCTPDPAAVATPDECPGGTTGTINGISTCVSFDPSQNVIESIKSKDVVSQGPNGGSNTNTTTTTTCNVSGACTTTVVTNTSSNGGPPSTNTETIKESVDDFCSKSPQDPQCKKSRFSSSCSSSPVCDGDAIQCAIVSEQHRRNCQAFDDRSSAEALLYDSEKGKTGSQQEAGGPGQTVNVGPGSFSATDVLGGGFGCISDKSVTVMGTSVNLPFSMVCQYLAIMGNILLAVSWLLAARIVVRG